MWWYNWKTFVLKKLKNKLYKKNNRYIVFVKEFNNYAWKVSGVTPIDNYNHGIDAARYLIQYLLGRTAPKGMYVVK